VQGAGAASVALILGRAANPAAGQDASPMASPMATPGASPAASPITSAGAQVDPTAGEPQQSFPLTAETQTLRVLIPSSPTV